MRGRMALHISGLAFEHREVILRDKPEHMLETSPKGTVPVYITENGKVIDESLDLMRYALAKNDPLNWLECNEAEADALLAVNDGPFKHNLDRYKYASRYKKDAKRGDIDLSHRNAAETHLKPLETRLSKTPYLLGDQQSYADIAIFPFIRQFANTDVDWWMNASYENLRQWLSRHIESKLFITIMKKHPQWVPKQAQA